MKIDLSHFLDTFLQESAEHLATIEAGLLRLKSSPEDRELLNGIFRAAHSIKGGAGAFGLNNVVKLTHALENLLDKMRNGEVKVSDEAISLMLRANDFLNVLTGGQHVPCPPGFDETIATLEVMAADDSNPQPVKPAAPTNTQPEQSELEYDVVFEPAKEVFSSGCNPLLLLRNLSQVGTVISTSLKTESLPALVDLDTSQCYLSWEVRLRTANTPAEIKEVFEFIEDQARVEITLVTAKPVIESQVSAETTATPERQNREGTSIRVSTDKIDKIIDLVGEMVIAQSMAAELVEHFSIESLDRLKECMTTLQRSIRELHEQTLSVRMLPVATVFGRFQRLVHDLAHKTGKQIALVTSGEDTEVDRGVLELLGDPLVHLIRNSADHGIETPAKRRAGGKPELGTISLRASHVGGNILVEIGDDGGGLDLVRIREIAIDKGLISATEEISQERIRSLIFEPGFSTRAEVSDLSGRGVGMDVVKRNVASLNGSITVDSELGRGTHVKIMLPLTLAIIDGLIVRVGSHHFVLPLGNIIETVVTQEDKIVEIAAQGEALRIRDLAMPLLRLHKIFGLPKPAAEGDEKSRLLVVVVESGSQKAALIVDELLGQQQLVVKNLEKHFRRVEGALGATILGDGSAALILDVAPLINTNPKADRTAKAIRPMSLVA